MRNIILASLALSASIPAVAQEGSGTPGDPIIVEGIRPGEDQPSVVSKLRQMIDETGDNQLARFEDEICPMVIGMPADLTVILTRIIRENIVASGGTLGGENCKVNAAAIFIDQPQELILALRKSEPNFFMNMTPSEFRQFSAQRRPVYSWHTTNRYTRDGIHMNNVSRNAAATRLYTNVRSEMESGIVVIDRQATIGKSLRQLGDFATMHLMLDVNWRARRMEASSILSLFHGRNSEPPLRMSSFDRNALSGFYLQRENNYTAAMQRQNIARSIERQEEGKPAVGTKDKK